MRDDWVCVRCCRVDDAAGTVKSTVFINDVAFEVPVGPFNVREAFGVEAVLVYSSGHPVPTDDWGLTLHSLRHGASYYLVNRQMMDLIETLKHEAEEMEEEL
ncbi:hypothetical protein RIF29_13695 [Crotalaria pallida]|uniref:Uncharacterized protein n=1 Tax=Crotalaria pallida TaxID=3830 RepID=A0AAN9IPP3_CROPI